MNNWQRLDTKIVYQNPYITVHEDTVVQPDGKPGQFGWVETTPAVFILAVDEHKKLVLVQQVRYVTGRTSWELPAGSTDGLDPLEAAKTELAQEAGLRADKWVQLTSQVYPWPSRTPEYNIICMASGLHEAKHASQQADDFITETKRVTWHEAVAMVKSGEIHNGQTISALMLAGIHFGHIK